MPALSVSQALRPAEAAAELAKLIREELRNHGRRDGWLRLALPVAGLDPYDWLAAQAEVEQLLWSGREERRCVAAIGVADKVTGDGDADPPGIVAQCRRRLSGEPEARYFGGFCFDAGQRPDAAWSPFGLARFVLPRFEVVAAAGGTRLVANLLPARDAANGTAILDELSRLTFEGIGHVERLPAIVRRQDTPDEREWRDHVASALDLIHTQTLEKIVLARRADFRFAAPVRGALIIAKLRQVTSNCYHFCFQPEAGVSFMGTTPERLFRRVDRLLQSEVIAGTRPRSADPAADDALARDLLASAKDQLEHGIVRKFLRQRLHLLCESLQVDEQARLLQLERKQHLYSGIIGTLRPDVGDGELIRRLHPTPAVGGYPSEVALAEIARLEPFRRGWYAAPVGWIGADDAEFAVAIRSGLVRGDTVSVYSGAGIVEGSKADDEWREIENKIVDFVRVSTMP